MSTGVAVHRIRHAWRFWLGMVISMVFLGLAVRQVNWTTTLAAMSSANLLLLGLGIGLLVVTFVLFAIRWQVLLASTIWLPVKETFSYIMIGYLANTVLPLRLGDIVRATLLGKRHDISISLVFGSVVLERILDVLTVLVLALGLSLVMDIPGIIRASMATIAGGALVALLGLLLLAHNQERIPGLVARLPGFIPRAPLERLVGLVARFASGLRTLRSGRQLAQALLLSGLAWAIAGLGAMCWVAAFHLPVPWYAGLFVLAVINLGGAIPSSPGAIGVYHYLAVLALSAWAVDKSAALGYAIATHGLNLVVTTSIGLVCLWRENIAVSRLGDLTEGVAIEVHAPD